MSYFPGVLTPGNQKDPVSISFTIKKTRFQYQSLYIAFGNCRGTEGIIWLLPSLAKRWRQIVPPEKHLKCHDKMAGNISVTKFDLPVQDGGEHISQT